MPLFDLAATSFATLFVAFGPIETAAVFGGLTAGVHRPERFRLAWRATVIAGVVILVFAFFGIPTLRTLHVSLDAFRVAGGVLLLLQAKDLLFAHRSGVSALTPGEEREAMAPGDIAVFPLAFPLIAGPASLTAVVLLMGQARDEPLQIMVVFACIVAMLAVTYASLSATEFLQRLLKTTGANVVARLSGLLLAALAMQYIFDGLKDSRLLGA
jgi:multiple antibiotic resistance protein